MSAVGLRIETPDALRVRNACARMERGKFLRRANAQIGKRIEKELRSFFAARPSNKRGWPTQHFWRRRIRNATLLTHFDEHGSTITIADPAMNLAIHGGVVRPREKKFLTVPATPRAYGRSPRTFGDQLIFIPLHHFARGTGGGKLVGMLVRKDKTGGAARKRSFTKSGGAGKLDVYYWCVAMTTHVPQRDALPSDTHFAQWVAEEVGKVFARELRKGVAQ